MLQGTSSLRTPRAPDQLWKMGSRGDCYDNAVCENFHASLEKDLLRRRSLRTRQEARTAVFDYI